MHTFLRKNSRSKSSLLQDKLKLKNGKQGNLKGQLYHNSKSLSRKNSIVSSNLYDKYKNLKIVKVNISN